MSMDSQPVESQIEKLRGEEFSQGGTFHPHSNRPDKIHGYCSKNIFQTPKRQRQKSGTPPQSKRVKPDNMACSSTQMDTTMIPPGMSFTDGDMTNMSEIIEEDPLILEQIEQESEEGKLLGLTDVDIDWCIKHNILVADFNKFTIGEKAIMKDQKIIRMNIDQHSDSIHDNSHSITENKQRISVLERTVSRQQAQIEDLSNKMRSRNIKILNLTENCSINVMKETVRAIINTISANPNRIPKSEVVKSSVNRTIDSMQMSPDNGPITEMVKHTICNLVDQLMPESSSPIEIDNIQRDYQAKGTGPRPIIVTLAKQEDRDYLLRNTRNLKDKQFLRCKITVTDDIDDLTMKKHTELLPVLTKMRNQGYYARIEFTTPRCIKYSTQKWKKDSGLPKPQIFTYTHNQLINGKPYIGQNATEQPDIPKSLDPIEFDNHILFKGKDSKLSNWDTHKFTIDGDEFTSNEQYIGYGRCKAAEDTNTEARILDEHDPRAIKRLFYEIKWNNIDPRKYDDTQTAFNGMMAKFTQNQDLKEYLISTHPKRIWEGTRDRQWGAGIDIHNPQDKPYMHDEASFQGYNLCGRLLESARAILMEHPTYVHLTTQKVIKNLQLHTFTLESIPE